MDMMDGIIMPCLLPVTEKYNKGGNLCLTERFMQ
jgi:hypothetical protein